MSDTQHLNSVSTGGGASFGGDTTVGGNLIGRDQTVSIYSGLTTREMFSLQIVRKYEQLWGFMEPFAEYAKPERLTYQSLREFSARLRRWYFEDAGGLYMRQISTDMPTRKAYMALQDGLRELTADPTMQATLEITEGDFRHIQSLARQLRYALSEELNAYIRQGDAVAAHSTAVVKQEV